MTGQEDVNTKLDDAAAKLDQAAGKLDEGAGKIHDAASALHQVAVPGTAASDASQHRATEANVESHLPDAAATTSHVTRVRASGLRKVVGEYGAFTIGVVRRRPLTALATLSAAAAFIEVELAVGLLAGIAGAAFLTNQPGAQTRQTIAEKSRVALARARESGHIRRQASKGKLTGPNRVSEAAPPS